MTNPRTMSELEGRWLEPPNEPDDPELEEGETPAQARKRAEDEAYDAMVADYERRAE